VLAAFEEQLADRQRLIQVPSAELCLELGINPGPDEVVIDRAAEKELDSLESTIEAAWARYASENRFADGFRRMRSFIPRLGLPMSSRRIRLLAKTRHYTAWYLVHSGQARSALDQALRAIALWLKAYAESDDRNDLAELAETALLASMAYQLCNEQERSARLLNLARSARKTAGQAESPEYFRQRGVVYLQLGQDPAARREFITAMERMRDLHDLPLATVEMMGTRQMNLLGTPDWDRAQELLANCSATFPAGTLQYSINVNWTAAVGIATGGPKATHDSLELLRLAEVTAKRFGHQATIHRLLSATPYLKLPPKLLQPWLRFALYYDAFRSE
jgi:tetratricopeptide (TPR) repeat protein